MSGNDFQTWTNPTDDAVALAVAKGIRSADPTHIQTVEPERTGQRFNRRSTLAVGNRARRRLHIRAYLCASAEGVQPQNHLPVVMIEAGYEFEQNQPSYSYGDRRLCESKSTGAF